MGSKIGPNRSRMHAKGESIKGNCFIPGDSTRRLEDLSGKDMLIPTISLTTRCPIHFDGQILSTRFDTHCYYNGSTSLPSYNQYQARQLQSIAMSQSDVQSPSSSKTKASSLSSSIGSILKVFGGLCMRQSKKKIISTCG
jgi:hypothetical protein